jgi:hypothetical protein
LRNVRFASLWWRDLCSLGRLSANGESDWCSDIMTKKLGDRGRTRFWLDKWMGPNPLCERFPHNSIWYRLNPKNLLTNWGNGGMMSGFGNSNGEDVSLHGRMTCLHN